MQSPICPHKPVIQPILFSAIAICCFTACSTSNLAKENKLSLVDYCIPANLNYNDAITADSPDTKTLLANNAALAKYFSPADILIANATGTLELINQLFRDSSMYLKNEAFLLKDVQIRNRIMLMESELDGVISELQCETERTSRVTAFLDNINKKRTNQLTVGAIIAGALTTITPIVVSNTSVQNSIVIAGGAATIVLGILVLNPKGKKIQMKYPNNLLTD